MDHVKRWTDAFKKSEKMDTVAFIYESIQYKIIANVKKK